MAKFTSLRDAYRHPGFVPMARIQTIENDSSALVVSLRRRKKMVWGKCGQRQFHIYDRTRRQARDLDCGGRIVLLEFEVH